jgi:predicted enzyme related to lactoylglutathione lyase
MEKVTHFEIPTGDKARGKAFYSGVFGWEINDVPVQMEGGTTNYTTCRLSTRPAPGPGGVPGPGVSLYLLPSNNAFQRNAYVPVVCAR